MIKVVITFKLNVISMIGKEGDVNITVNQTCVTIYIEVEFNK